MHDHGKALQEVHSCMKLKPARSTDLYVYELIRNWKMISYKKLCTNSHILSISSESCQFSLKPLQLGVEQEHSIYI